MKILDVNNDSYTVLDLVSRNAQTVHVSRVYPFYYDPSRVDPENVALRDLRSQGRAYAIPRSHQTLQDRTKKATTTNTNQSTETERKR